MRKRGECVPQAMGSLGCRAMGASPHPCRLGDGARRPDRRRPRGQDPARRAREIGSTQKTLHGSGDAGARRAARSSGAGATAGASAASGEGQTMTGHGARRRRCVAGERVNAGASERGRPRTMSAAPSAVDSRTRFRPTAPSSTRMPQVLGAIGAIVQAISSSIRRPRARRAALVARTSGDGMPTAVAGNRRGGTT